MSELMEIGADGLSTAGGGMDRRPGAWNASLAQRHEPHTEEERSYHCHHPAMNMSCSIGSYCSIIMKLRVKYGHNSAAGALLSTTVVGD